MSRDHKIQELLELEQGRQEKSHKFIASENYASDDVSYFVGSVFSNKYCEGYPGRRYYNGCLNFDKLEKHGNATLRNLYGCKFSNIQPHSGANANLAVYKAFLNPGDTTLGMSLTDGGHLSHGSSANISGQWFKPKFYGVNPNGLIDYQEVYNKAQEIRPQLLIAGASAYPRRIDWKAFREIADSINCKLLVDMAHYSGLIAGGVYPNPLPYADIVTSTTHKTLRGARGGMILWNDEKYTRRINSAVFPGVQGGPLMNQVAGKAQAFYEATHPDFKKYAVDVVRAAKLMCEVFIERGINVITGGTDSHIVLVGTGQKTGADVANTLEEKHCIIVNKNTIPNDKRSVMKTSGIRLGTAAMVTKKGFDVSYFKDIANKVSDVILEGV